MTVVLVDTETDKERHVTTEAETRETHLPAKERQALLAASEAQGKA